MQLWTKEHALTLLPALAVMIILSVVLRILLRNKSEKIRMIPIQTVALLLVVIEIGKQAISLYRGYDLYHLPFHFCSLFIFMLPLMAFYRGRRAKEIRGITAALCAAVLLLILIYPNLIYSAYDVTNFFKDYMCFHTVFFHNLVMLAAFLIPMLGLHTPESTKKELLAVTYFTLGFSVVAAVMSQLLKTNYANMYSCNVPPLEAVRLAVQEVLGYALTQVLYDLAVTVLQILFTLMAYGFYRLLCQLTRGCGKIKA